MPDKAIPSGWLRRLPDGKAISALGFGCSSLWAKRGFDPAQAQAILETAERCGINHFDTGPSYADGEPRLGRFLAQRDLDGVVISTKIGTHAREDGSRWRSFKVEDLRRSFERSLERLGVERVDILYLHGPTIADLDEELLRYLEELKTSGRIGYSGVNSFDLPVVRALLDLPIDVVMLQYNLADLRFENLIPELHRRGKIVMAGTIMAQGIYDLRGFLPTDAKKAWYLLRALKNDPLFALHGARLARRLRAEKLEPHDAAVRFVAGHPLIHSGLFGTTRSTNVEANTASARQPMDAALRARLGAAGEPA